MKKTMFKVSYLLFVSVVVLGSSSLEVFCDDSSYGEVKAVILNKGDNSPFDNYMLMLFPTKKDKNEMVSIVSFDYRASTNDKGQIHFKNIPPGIYTLHGNLLGDFKDEHGMNLFIKI